MRSAHESAALKPPWQAGPTRCGQSASGPSTARPGQAILASPRSAGLQQPGTTRPQSKRRQRPFRPPLFSMRLWEAFRSAPLSLHSGVRAETSNFRVWISNGGDVTGKSTYSRVSQRTRTTPTPHSPQTSTWARNHLENRTLHVMSPTPDTHGLVSRDSIEMAA